MLRTKRWQSQIGRALADERCPRHGAVGSLPTVGQSKCRGYLEHNPEREETASSRHCRRQWAARRIGLTCAVGGRRLGTAPPRGPSPHTHDSAAAWSPAQLWCTWPPDCRQRHTAAPRLPVGALPFAHQSWGLLPLLLPARLVLLPPLSQFVPLAACGYLLHWQVVMWRQMSEHLACRDELALQPQIPFGYGHWPLRILWWVNALSEQLQAALTSGSVHHNSCHFVASDCKAVLLQADSLRRKENEPEETVIGPTWILPPL